MNNHDTSSVNHVSKVYAIGKLSKREHEVAQTLADCCKASIENCVLPEDVFGGNFVVGSIPSNQNKVIRMNKLFLYASTMNHFIVTIVGFSLTYNFSKQKNKELTDYPYISDTASDYPESSIFALSLNWIAGSVSLAAYVRHLLTLQVLRDRGQDAIKKIWVKLGVSSGFLTALSIQIIGCFQPYNVSEFGMHFAGVTGFFVFLAIYVFVQTKLTYDMIGVISDRRIFCLRLALSIIMLGIAFAALVPGVISWRQFHGTDMKKWKPSDGGWIFHIISVIAEWMYVIVGDLFIMTFAYEFRMANVKKPEIEVTYLSTKGKADFKTRAL